MILTISIMNQFRIIHRSLLLLTLVMSCKVCTIFTSFYLFLATVWAVGWLVCIFGLRLIDVLNPTHQPWCLSMLTESNSLSPLGVNIIVRKSTLHIVNDLFQTYNYLLTFGACLSSSTEPLRSVAHFSGLSIWKMLRRWRFYLQCDWKSIQWFDAVDWENFQV